MPLGLGAKIGPFEILSPLGAGGMGEVYRARDVRLNREVAIKVLPTAFSRDPERLRRFQQEAQAVAALNHPNILAIHDFGEHQGSPYIVTEFLEGETLRSRLAAGALPVRKATELAQQVAVGLAAAHDKGIVHRDLKPENIFVTRDGRVKILDFGLAKLTPDAAAPDAATLASRTEPGVVMGTVGYMSPEQVKGQAADYRTDLFSYGAILYEMLSGKRAFHGQTPVETMSAILREDPPELMETARTVPPALDRIVRHCLDKNPAERFQSARDVAFNLGSLSEISGSGVAMRPSKRLQRRAAGRLAAGGLLLVVGLVVGLWWPRNPQSSAPVFHRITYRVGTVDRASFTPDGHTIVYDASWDGRPFELFTTRAEFPQPQDLGLASARIAAISNTNEMALLLRGGGMMEPDATLARAPLSGGAPREVLEHVRDAAWGPDGNLAVVHIVNGRDRLEYPIGKLLYETSGWIDRPQFSRKGDRIAFLDHTVWPDSRGQVAVVDLGGKKQTLTQEWEDQRGLAWSATGDEIWFAASEKGGEDHLYAVSLAGRQRPILSVPSRLELHDILPDGRVLLGSSDYRVRLMGRAAGAEREQDLSWYDITYVNDISADGRKILFDEEGEQGGPKYSVGMRGLDGSPVIQLGEGYSGKFSPDGRWASSFKEGPPPEVTLLPTAAGEPRSVPLPGIERIALPGVGFFPDGKRIWFCGSQPSGSLRTYAQNIEGGKPIAITPDGVLADAISPDGEFVVAADRQGSISLFPTDGGPARSLPGVHGLSFVQWSTDGRLMYARDHGLPTTVYKVDLSTGQKTVAFQLIGADPAGVRNITDLVVSRDGKSYAYNYERALSQLLVVEGLK